VFSLFILSQGTVNDNDQSDDEAETQAADETDTTEVDDLHVSESEESNAPVEVQTDEIIAETPAPAAILTKEDDPEPASSEIPAENAETHGSEISEEMDYVSCSQDESEKDTPISARDEAFDEINGMLEEDSDDEKLNDSIIIKYHSEDDTSARQETGELGDDEEKSVVEETLADDDLQNNEQEMADVAQREAETESEQVPEVIEQDHEMTDTLPPAEEITKISSPVAAQPEEPSKVKEMEQENIEIATPAAANLDIVVTNQNEEQSAKIGNAEDIGTDTETNEVPSASAPPAKEILAADAEEQEQEMGDGEDIGTAASKEVPAVSAPLVEEKVAADAEDQEQTLSGSPKDLDADRSRPRKRSPRVFGTPPKGSRKSTRARTVPKNYREESKSLQRLAKSASPQESVKEMDIVPDAVPVVPEKQVNI
jgi:hypothetical protein